MTNEQILKKAIEKADKNGWKNKCHPPRLDILKLVIKQELYQAIIFNHDFAKAIWGDKQEHFSKWGRCKKSWKGHLMIMVLEEEPLKYLEKFL